MKKNNIGLSGILLMTIVFNVSCDKKEYIIENLDYTTNNISYGLQGRFQIYSDIAAEANVGLDYYLTSKYDSSIYIQAYDSTLEQTSFVFPNFQAKYSYTDTNKVLKKYQAISGLLTITSIEGGIGLGTFSFQAINILDESDTININNGYFEITVEKYDRIF